MLLNGIGVEEKLVINKREIIFCANGIKGDVYPLVDMASELRDRGHRVTVLANNYFKAFIGDCGLELFGIGTTEQYQAFNKDLLR